MRKSSFFRGAISVVFTVMATSSLIFAGQISSVIPQSISEPWVIDKPWYQDVNDRLMNLFFSGGTFTLSGNVVTNGSIDAQWCHLCRHANS